MPTVTDKLMYSALALVPFFLVFWSFLWIVSQKQLVEVDRSKRVPLIAAGVGAHVVFYLLLFAFMYVPVPDSKKVK